MLACLVWGFRNFQYPVADPADFMAATQKIYYGAKTGGILGFLHNIYMTRVGYKPVLFPAIGSLVMLLSGGSALWTIRIHGALYLLLLLFFSFLSFEIVLPLAETAVATLAVGMIPWCIHGSRFYAMETPALALTVAAGYFLYRFRKADSVSSARWLGWVFGICLCIRPTEILSFYFAPILVWLAWNLKERRLRVRDVLVNVAVTIPFVVAVLAISRGVYFPNTEGVRTLERLTWLIGPAGLVFLFRKRIGLSSPLNTVVSISYVLAAVWYAPFIQVLYQWFFDASFSPVVKKLWDEAGVSHFQNFITAWVDLGGLPLLLAGVGGLIGILPVLCEKKLHFWLLLITVTVLFPTIVGSRTYNVGSRYYYASAFLAYGAAIVFALRRAGSVIWLRRCLVLASLFICLSWSWHSTLNPGLAMPLSLNPKDGYLAFQTDPAGPSREIIAMVEGLHRVFPGPRLKVGMLRLQWREDQTHFFEQDFTQLMIGARDQGLDWDFDFFSEEGSHEGFDVVFLGPLEGNRQCDDPDCILGGRLSSMTRPERETKGWHQIGEIEVPDGTHLGHFLLFKPPV